MTSSKKLKGILLDFSSKQLDANYECSDENREKSYIETQKRIEQLISDTVNKVLDEIKKPKLNDVKLMQPSEYQGGVIIDNYYRSLIDKIRSEWK